VKFDHDFVGREALQKIAGQPHRKKVTFAWNADDVARVFRSMYEPGAEAFKYIDVPNANYASSNYDAVTKNGKTVGLSMFAGCSYNERAWLSLGVVDPDIQVGDVLSLVWGEENGGTKKTTVERHKQTEIRVKVSPVPYSRDARETYAEGWRTQQNAA
jgi:vanillate/3-O-methylgallate O-demethylase